MKTLNNRTLNDSPAGNSEFVSPRPRETKLTVSPGASIIKCLLMTHAHFMGCHTGDVFVQLIVRKQNCETGARNIAGPGCSKAG